MKVLRDLGRRTRGEARRTRTAAPWLGMPKARRLPRLESMAPRRKLFTLAGRGAGQHHERMRGTYQVAAHSTQTGFRSERCPLRRRPAPGDLERALQ